MLNLLSPVHSYRNRKNITGLRILSHLARCLIGYQTIDIFHSIHFLKYLYHTLTFIPEITLCAQDIVQFIIFQIIYAQYQAKIDESL